MAIAVVAIHMELFGRYTIYDTKEYLLHRFSMSDLATYHVLTLAVPAFFLMSLFLFSLKVRSGNAYFLKRTEKLIYLYVFWLTAIVLWRGGSGQALQKNDLREFLVFSISGDHSLFYFFFSLIITTCVSFLTRRLPPALFWLLLAVSASLLWLMPLYRFKTGLHASLVTVWNPANFLVYVFVAGLAARYHASPFFQPSSRMFTAVVAFLALLFITSSIFEWQWMVNERNFAGNQCIIPPYTRLSVAAGSSFLFFLSFLVSRPPSALIKFLSDYSLGLYCIHVFIMEISEKMTGLLHLSLNITVKFLLVLALSCACAYLARRAFSKGLV